MEQPSLWLWGDKQGRGELPGFYSALIIPVTGLI